MRDIDSIGRCEWIRTSEVGAGVGASVGGGGRDKVRVKIGERIGVVVMRSRWYSGQAGCRQLRRCGIRSRRSGLMRWRMISMTAGCEGGIGETHNLGI